jgi:ABC-type uncharacterized transport system ATPase subunit
MSRDAATVAGVDPVAEPPRSGLAMRGIVKRFGPTTANRDIDLDVRPGEIHALLGENGAGKTTLMQVLYGLLQPDQGEIFVDGEPVRFATPLDAGDAGIGMVHQHFKLVPNLTVVENVLLGAHTGMRLPRRALRQAAEKLTSLGREHGLEVPPFALVRDLSVGEQQRTEILKVLFRGARYLILDEPTANLAAPEISRLLTELRAMARAGTGLVVITHHLDEAIESADRITVLRHGRHVATLTPRETDVRSLAQLMVGRAIEVGRVRAADVTTRAASAQSPEALLSVEGLQVERGNAGTSVNGVSFAVPPGEIVAIAGVEGNGQHELEEALLGLRPAQAGSVRLRGEPILGLGPGAMLQRGVGFIPADRYRRGLVRELSIADNLVLDRAGDPPFGTWWTVRRKSVEAHGAEMIRRFSIRAPSPRTPAGRLSGGHAQRVVLARALRDDVSLVIASQPTRGLDVGAAEFVWEKLVALCRRGVGVLLLSTDLDEVLALADHCHVIYRGRLAGHFESPATMRAEIGEAMGGLTAATAGAQRSAG